MNTSIVSWPTISVCQRTAEQRLDVPDRSKAVRYHLVEPVETQCVLPIPFMFLLNTLLYIPEKVIPNRSEYAPQFNFIPPTNNPASPFSTLNNFTRCYCLLPNLVEC
jgi:hypothetical protein